VGGGGSATLSLSPRLTSGPPGDALRGEWRVPASVPPRGLQEASNLERRPGSHDVCVRIMKGWGDARSRRDCGTTARVSLIFGRLQSILGDARSGYEAHGCCGPLPRRGWPRRARNQTPSSVSTKLSGAGLNRGSDVNAQILFTTGHHVPALPPPPPHLPHARQRVPVLVRRARKCNVRTCTIPPQEPHSIN
jgi:hypothetical protein